MALNRKLFNKAAAAAAEAEAIKPSEHFETVLYTGNNSTNNIEGGWIGKGALFDGTNDYISFTDKLTPSSGGFSISWWMNWEGDADYAYVFDNGGGSASSGLYCIVHDTTDTLYFGFKNGSTLFQSNVGAPSIEKNEWIHWVLSWDGTTGTDAFKVYKNKTATNYTSTVTNTTAGYNFRIGESNGTGGEHFKGKIDHFRIFNKAISSSEVDTLYDENAENTSGFTTDIFGDGSGVALYEFEGTGSTLNVKATNAGTGNFKSTTALKNEGAAFFDGSNDYIDLTSHRSAFQIDTFSISVWIKTNSASTRQDFFSTYDNNASTNYGAVLQITSAGKIRFFGYGTGSNTMEYVSTNTISADTWTHIAFTKNAGTDGKIYIDGVEETLTTESHNVLNYWSGGYVSLGALFYTGGTLNVFDGQIKDFRFYSDVLTGTEVDHIYDNTTASIPTDYSAYYKLNGNALDETGDYDGTVSGVKWGYDATNSGAEVTSQLNFSPDFIWFKSRSAARSNAIVDTVRGNRNIIWTDLTSKAYDSDVGDDVVSFDDNGFTLGPVDNAGSINTNNDTIVAWCLKAGGSGSTFNIDGTGYSTASAAGLDGGDINPTGASINTTAGFSILEYDGSGTSGDTLAHGLNGQPNFIMVRPTDNTTESSWEVYQSDVCVTDTSILRLNTSNPLTTVGTAGFDFSEINDTTVTLKTSLRTNASGNSYIMYLFQNIDGFSKTGSYSGNDGVNHIETGFEPAFVMIKPSTATDNWLIYDKRRGGNAALFANLTNAETTYSGRLSFTSDGFVLDSDNDGWNGTGNTYIYLAFAAEPDTTTPAKSKSFDVISYTGDGDSGGQSITDSRFSPDLVILKDRDSTENWGLGDSVRGYGYLLYPNLNNTQVESSYIAVTDNGFDVTTSNYNTNTNDYSAYAWKAGDHDSDNPEINTNGSIDSVVSVNDEAGFSIVKFDIPSSGSSETIGHGLSSAPEWMLVKTLDKSGSWFVYHTSLGNTKEIYLELTNAAGTDTNRWNSTSPTATVFTIGSSWLNATYSGAAIAYCWTPKSEYSKFGTYDGNNSSTSVTTGFKPDFVVVKRTSATGNWQIWDSVANPSADNSNNNTIYFNLNNAEADSGTGRYISFDSNGFTIYGDSGDSNANSHTYIYAAFKIN